MEPNSHFHPVQRIECLIDFDFYVDFFPSFAFLCVQQPMQSQDMNGSEDQYIFRKHKQFFLVFLFLVMLSPTPIEQRKAINCKRKIQSKAAFYNFHYEWK